MYISTNVFAQKQYQPRFQSKTSVITTERLTSLIKSEKTVKEMKSKLGIALDTFYKLLREREIEYKRQSLQDLINSGKKVKEICKELGISEKTYSRLLNKFEIKHRRLIKP